MDARAVSVEGVSVPRFLYGTAWKEERTAELTALALATGFRGIDTANQRRHYHESGVGEGIARAIADGLVHRGDLFLQTKYTFRPGQDDRLPYDPEAPIATQVEQSFASSLEHLGTDHVDGYLLHGPIRREGFLPPDWTAWRAMEAIHDRGQARLLGVANVTIDQLRTLTAGARIPPLIVQNRCRADHAWDRDVRAFCRTHGMIYQAFALLTANRAILSHPELIAIAARYDRSPGEVVFRFALDSGLVPLTGTSDPAHMRADLSAFHFQLESAEVGRIEELGR